MPRKLVVTEQLKDLQRWRKKHGYGSRWISESAISSIESSENTSHPSSGET